MNEPLGMMPTTIQNWFTRGGPSVLSLSSPVKPCTSASEATIPQAVTDELVGMGTQSWVQILQNQIKRLFPLLKFRKHEKEKSIASQPLPC